jgi:predicted nucleic acid-binding protein
MVDSSAWIDYLRKGEGATADRIDELIDSGCASICGVIEMELLHGCKKTERRELEELLSALDYVEAARDDYIAAGELLSELRQAGIKIPATDALIAALCIRENLPLLTLDKHFERITRLKLLPADDGQPDVGSPRTK